jgi:L,D-transpeptidase catalytic domain
MQRIAACLVAAILLCAFARAEAAVVVTVDKTAQRLTVVVDGVTRYRWPVSTARWGYRTPNGSYRPQRLARTWFSRKYDMSPMPHSIFFAGGYAIHGSYEISRLGRPASHGCIRLHPANAAMLFALVQENVRDTRIVVTGDHPPAIEVRQRIRPIEPGAPEPRMLPPGGPYSTYSVPAPYRGESFEDIFERRQPGPYYGPHY